MTTLCLRRMYCGNGDECPSIDQDEKGDFLITGYKPGAPHTAENEIINEVPASVLPRAGGPARHHHAVDQ